MILLLLACATLPTEPVVETVASDAEPTVVAAASTDASAPQSPQAEDTVSETELTSPHFSAEQIRAGMPVGTTLVFQTATFDTVVGTPIVGMETQEMQWEVVASGTAEMTMRYTQLGDPASAPMERVHTWAELATHSQFPASMTTRKDGVSVSVPAGTFTCTRYTVREPGAELSVYDFAEGLAGPPIRMVQTVSGQDRMRMELLRRAVP